MVQSPSYPPGHHCSRYILLLPLPLFFFMHSLHLQFSLYLSSLYLISCKCALIPSCITCTSNDSPIELHSLSVSEAYITVSSKWIIIIIIFKGRHHVFLYMCHSGSSPSCRVMCNFLRQVLHFLAYSSGPHSMFSFNYPLAFYLPLENVEHTSCSHFHPFCSLGQTLVVCHHFAEMPSEQGLLMCRFSWNVCY